MSARVAWIFGMCWMIFAGPILAQKTPAQSNPQSPSPGSSGSGTATAQGITWPQSSWESLTDLDDLKARLGISDQDKSVAPRAAKKHLSNKEHPLYLLCYSLDITTGSLSTPPFVFRQVANIEKMNGECFNTAKSKKPLMARGFLGVAIDARHVPRGRMRSFNLTLTTAAGQPINLYPVRPSVGSSSGGSGGGQTTPGTGGARTLTDRENPTWGRIYYLIWPQELGGDVIPTVNVSVAYTPSLPGASWQSSTVYPEGSIVTPPTESIPTCGDNQAVPPGSPTFSGHYFIARRGGISTTGPSPGFCVTSTKDGTVWWVDSGTTSPVNAPAATNSPSQGGAQASINPWSKGKPIDLGTVVFSPATSHYYVATKPGTSGSDDPFHDQKSIPDGPNLSWLIFGKNAPPVGSAPNVWDHTRTYTDGETVFDSGSGNFFTARVADGFASAKPGDEYPFRKYSTTLTYTDSPPAGAAVIWLDVGSTAPLPSQPLKLPTPVHATGAQYGLGEVTFDPDSGHFYTVVFPGISASSHLKTNTPARVEEAAPALRDIPEDFFHPLDGLQETGAWKSKDDPKKSPPCANKLPPPFPNWNPYAFHELNDCIVEPYTGMIFQLTEVTNAPPVLASVPANISANGGPTPFSELFLDTAGATHEITWAGKDDSPACARCVTVTVADQNSQLKLPVGVRPGDTLSAFPAPRIFSFTAASLIHTQPGLPPIQWEDIGTTVPSLISGGEPADQTVAQAYTLTQVHPKYYFNISTGLVVSTIHSRTFGWATNAPSLYTPIQTASNPIIDPVLFLTVYWPKLPMDAESPWKWSNAVPAPTLGMSFVSPTSNLYFGLSSEIRRNIQIVFGGSTAQPQRLSSTSVSTTNTGTPPTAQIRTFGGFVGFSLNISGFIQTVLGGK